MFMDNSFSSTRAQERAVVVATAIRRILADVLDPDKRQLRIEQYLRDELANIERQVAADRSDCCA
jgi:hypothetical protein